MDSLPFHLQEDLNRRRRSLNWSSCVTTILMGVVIVWPTLPALLGAPIALAWMGWAIFRGFDFDRQLPLRLEEHKRNEEERRDRQREWGLQQAASLERAAQLAISAQTERTSRFLAVLEEPAGYKIELETPYGSFWATRCINGGLRLWWPYFSQLLELANPIVKGRAHWKRDNIEGWFVPACNARSIMADLSQL